MKQLTCNINDLIRRMGNSTTSFASGDSLFLSTAARKLIFKDSDYLLLSNVLYNLKPFLIGASHYDDILPGIVRNGQKNALSQLFEKPHSLGYQVNFVDSYIAGSLLNYSIFSLLYLTGNDNTGFTNINMNERNADLEKAIKSVLVIHKKYIPYLYSTLLLGQQPSISILEFWTKDLPERKAHMGRAKNLNLKLVIKKDFYDLVKVNQLPVFNSQEEKELFIKDKFESFIKTL